MRNYRQSHNYLYFNSPINIYRVSLDTSVEIHVGLQAECPLFQPNLEYVNEL
jgi:hypothetical protein